MQILFLKSHNTVMILLLYNVSLPVHNVNSKK